MARISNMLDLHVGHLAPDLRKRLVRAGADGSLDDITDVPMTIPHNYGWIMWVDEDKEDYWLCVAEAIRLAQQLDCRWINFDDSHPIEPSLVHYGDE